MNNNSKPLLPHLDVYIPMMKNAAILSAVELGVFQHLHQSHTVAALAQLLKISEKGMRCLLEVLVTAGYVKREGDRYINEPFTTEWFTENSQFDYTPALLWMTEAWKLLEELPQALRKERPSPNLWQRMEKSPEMGKKFSRYMLAYARHCLDDILNLTTIPSNAKRLLDIGGSHGLYSVAFCQKYPQLQATIFDFPESLRETTDLIEKNNLKNKIRTLEGNALTGDWGKSYDVILFFSLIHNHTLEENKILFKKIFDSLNPGGMLIIYDYMSDQAAPDYNAAFNLTLFLEVGTHIFSFKDISNWLDENGFINIQRRDLQPLEKGSLIISQKPV